MVCDKYLLRREIECINEFMSYGQISSGYSEWISLFSDLISELNDIHQDSNQILIKNQVPFAFRKSFWSKKLAIEINIDYHRLTQFENKFTDLIKLDVPRTFVDLPFVSPASEQKLCRILNAFSNSNEDIGYYQGMNYIAGTLLLVYNLNEVEAFKSFLGIMLRVDLSSLYKNNFKRLSEYILRLNRVFQLLFPELKEHFSNAGIDFTMYLQQWFLTLFTYSFPLRTVLILWDYILVNGIESIIVLSISIISIFEKQLLQMNTDEICSFFRSYKHNNTYYDYEMAFFIIKQANNLCKTIEVN